MNNQSRTPTHQTHANDALNSYNILDDLIDDYLGPFPTLAKTSSASDTTKRNQAIPSPLKEDVPSPLLRGQKSTPVLISSTEISVVSSSSNPSVPASSSSRWKTVLDETVYFAGGLISHPFESTKHYSILRHSAALVYYKGPSTNVTITVFGDSMPPADRSFWIQRKGYSGNMGMAASALMRTTSNWIDVTPTIEASVSSVLESDERAWQRDIKKFLKRASKEKRLCKHAVRETCVLRIPAAAEDGYLRIVMCTGQDSKKSLCPSPTFRLASTSSDVSVLRGASLASLPLEVGLKAASIVGNQYAQRIMGPAQTIVQNMQPFMKNNPDTVALVRSGMEEQFNELEENYDVSRDVNYSPFHGEGILDESPNIIGNDSGPENPYPIRFSGVVVPGTGQSRIRAGTPTANLRNIPGDLLLRLNGIYIGWAAIDQKMATRKPHFDWHEAIITVGPSPYDTLAAVARKVITVHIVHDFGESAPFFNAKLKVIMMAFLRPNPKLIHSRSPIVDLNEVSRDRAIAVASLSREGWQPEASLEKLSSEKSQRTMTERYVGMRAQVQRHVDSFPIHRAGIRTERAEIRDEAYGQGGFYIRR